MGNIGSIQRWYWSDGILRVYSPSTPDVEVSCQGNTKALVVYGASFITFRELTFRGGSTCVDVQSSHTITFDSCDIGDMVGNYGMWIKYSTNGEVKNCNIDRKDYVKNTWYPIWGGFNAGGGDCISLRSGSSYWDIHHNFIAGPSHDAVGIGADQGYSPETPTPGPCVGNQIRDNELRGGNGYSRAFNIHGGYPGTDNRIYNNYVHDFTEHSQISGSRNWVYYNLIDTVRVSLAYGGPDHWYQSAGIGGSDGVCADIRIFNNTIRNVDAAGIRVMYSWINPTIENNLIYNTGREWHGSVTDYNFYHVGIEVEAQNSGGWQIRSGGTIRNNIMYGTDLDSNRAVIWAGSAQQGAPVSNKIPPHELNEKNGTNGMVISGNRFVDPRLQSDMKIGAGSPAADAGVPNSVTKDFWGTTVPYNGAPDIGAHEWTPSDGTVTLPAPALSAPPNGSTGLSAGTTLSWSSVSGGLSYRVQVSADPQFTLLALDTSLGTTTIQVARFSPSMTYFWRVRASNAAGPGSFSPTWIFTTANLSVSAVGRDITGEGTPVALVTAPLGSGSRSLEVMRDGVYPAAGTTDPSLQYDTWNGQARTLDWVGYTYANTRSFSRVVFQEGIRSLPAGGWFSQLTVQVRTGGQWVDVGGVAGNLTYSPNSGASYAIYEFTFPIVSGDGIRVAGVPGGTATYISVAELRVYDTSTSVTLSAPRHIFPSANAADVPVSITMRWGASAGAAKYHLQLSTDAGFRTYVVNDSTLSDTVRAVGPLGYAKGFYWRVRSLGGGAQASVFSSATFFVTADTTVGKTTDAPLAPRHIFPVANAVEVPVSINVRWSASAGAAKYHIQLSTDAGFRTYVVNDSTLTDTLRAVGPLAYAKIFYWRVRALGKELASPYSSTFSFVTVDTTSGKVSGIPALAAPPDNAGVSPASPVQLVWAAVPAASMYRVQVSFDSTFAGLVRDTTVTTTSVELSPLLPGMQYFWRVAAHAVDGAERVSTVWRFAVVGPVSAILVQNYPNPFNPATSIMYNLEREGHVELKVFSILGQEVATLVNNVETKGMHQVRFDPAGSGLSLASGVYLYRLKADDYVEVRKMVYSK